MAVVQIKDKVTSEDLKKARRDHGNFIQLAVDVETGTIAIGGEMHADAEQTLLDSGSNPEHVWGGSINLQTKKIETSALINVRPELGNDSQEILNPEKRERFIGIVKEKFGL